VKHGAFAWVFLTPDRFALYTNNAALNEGKPKVPCTAGLQGLQHTWVPPVVCWHRVPVSSACSHFRPHGSTRAQSVRTILCEGLRCDRTGSIDLLSFPTPASPSWPEMGIEDLDPSTDPPLDVWASGTAEVSPESAHRALRSWRTPHPSLFL
jgi:hypothetical protein